MADGAGLGIAIGFRQVEALVAFRLGSVPDGLDEHGGTPLRVHHIPNHTLFPGSFCPPYDTILASRTRPKHVRNWLSYERFTARQRGEDQLISAK